MYIIKQLSMGLIMDLQSLYVALPALSAVCSVSFIIVKAAVSLIKTMTAKFEGQMLEKFTSFEKNSTLTNNTIKDEVSMLRESLEKKLDHIEKESHDSRVELREYVSAEFRKIDDRMSRYENIQLEQKDQIHKVEMDLVNFKIDIIKITHSTDQLKRD